MNFSKGLRQKNENKKSKFKSMKINSRKLRKKEATSYLNTRKNGLNGFLNEIILPKKLRNFKMPSWTRKEGRTLLQGNMNV